MKQKILLPALTLLLLLPQWGEAQVSKLEQIKNLEAFLPTVRELRHTNPTNYVNLVQVLLPLYVQTGMNAKAESLTAETIGFMEELGVKSGPEYAMMQLSYGVLLSENQKFADSDTQLEAALEELSSFAGGAAYGISLDTMIAKATAYRGTNQDGMGNPAQAVKFFEKAIKICEQQNRTKTDTYGQILDMYGLMHKRNGNYAAALAQFAKAKAVFLQTSGAQSVAYARNLVNTAATQMQVEQYQQAEANSEAALAILTKADHFLTVNAAHNLAGMYTDLGKLKLALSWYDQTLNWLSERGEEQSFKYALSLQAKGVALLNFDKAGEALPNFQHAKKLLTNIYGAESKEVAMVEANLANTQLQLGYYDQALAHTKKAEQIFRQTGMGQTDRFHTLQSNMGVIYLEKGALKDAEKYLNNALEGKAKTLSKRSYSYLLTLSQLAQCEARLGKTAKAHAHFLALIEGLQQVINRDFPFLDERSRQLYWVLRFNPLLRAINEHCSAHTNEQNLLQAWYGLHATAKGSILTGTAKVQQEILASQDEALITDYAKLLFLRTLIGKYEAASAEERQNLNREFVGEQRLGDRQISCRVAVNGYQELYQSFQLLRNRIARRSAAFFRQQSYLQTTSFAEVKAALKPGEAAVEIIRYLEYSHGGEAKKRYTAFIIRADQAQLQAVSLPNGDELDGRFALMYQRQYIDLNIPAPQLYTQYWARIAEHLPKGGKVYLATAGVYNVINLAALKTPQGRYLGEALDLIQLTNTRDLTQAPAQHRAEGQIYLIGNPTFEMGQQTHQQHVNRNRRSQTRGETEAGTGALISKDLSVFGAVLSDWSPLFGTKLEVEKIAQLLRDHGKDIRLLTEAEATEENIKLAKAPRVLHLATHGYFEKDRLDFLQQQVIRHFNPDRQTSEAMLDPMLKSGIVLAGVTNYYEKSEKPDTEDGLLTAYEIAQLDLENTELVVLSACQSGLGEQEDVLSSEGVFGLRRAFRMAGVKSILMSLWKVDDNATQLLMRFFYQAWISEGLSQTAALKKAQEQLRQIPEYEAPKYWAAFILVSQKS